MDTSWLTHPLLQRRCTVCKLCPETRRRAACEFALIMSSLHAAAPRFEAKRRGGPTLRLQSFALNGWKSDTDTEDDHKREPHADGGYM